MALPTMNQRFLDATSNTAKCETFRALYQQYGVVKHRVVMSDVCERAAQSHPAYTRVGVVIEAVYMPHLAGVR